MTNPSFYPLYTNESRFLVLMGGAGSGKSHFAAQKVILRCMTEPDLFYVVFRKVGTTIRDSVFSLLRSVASQLGVAELWHTNWNTHTLTYLPNGSQVRCMGLDDPEKLKSIHGISSVWCEEGTELAKNDFEQINLRLRGNVTGRYKQIIITFNPISIHHWLKVRFWDKRPKNAHIHRSTFIDNRTLDAEYVDELKTLADRDPNLWRIYGEGDWGQPGNLVLTNFVYDAWPTRIFPPVNGGGPVVATLGDDLFPGDELFYGLDFGFTNPTALIEVRMLDGVPYIRQRIYQTELTTPDLIAEMDRMEISMDAPIYADAAEPDRIVEMCEAGYNVYPADKGPGSLNAGIVLMKCYPLHTSPDNTDLNDEATNYSWAKRRDGTVLDYPADEYNHAIDALRYAIYTHLRVRAERNSVVVTDLVRKAQQHGGGIAMLPGETL